MPLSLFAKERKRAVVAPALVPVAVTGISIAVTISPKTKNKRIPHHEGFFLFLISNEMRYTAIATRYGIIIYARNANTVKTGGHAS